MRESPELRVGFGYTLGLALVVAAARVLLPILIQQVIDKGINGPDGFDGAFVLTITTVVGVITIALYFAARATYTRLVRASEKALYSLRVRTFRHIHELSIGDAELRRNGGRSSRG